MTLYFYAGNKEVAATSLADLALLIAALANPGTATNAATIDAVTGRVETLVQSDTGEPLNLYFYDDATTVSSWVTDATVTLAAGLGDLDPGTAHNYASAVSFTIVGNARVGTLALNTAELTQAFQKINLIGRWPVTTTQMYLHVRKYSATLVSETVGLIPIRVSSGVLVTSPIDSAVEAAAAVTQASVSAAAAAVSASSAATSASQASASATSAAAQASAAQTSATSAASSATTATSQASTATTQASNAATSATNAAGSATTATAQAVLAAASAASAASIVGSGNGQFANVALTGVDSVKSAAGRTLALGTASFGTSVTFASATGIPTFATGAVFTGGLSGITTLGLSGILASTATTFGTSTTAAAITGKSLGLTENLWVGGTANVLGNWINIANSAGGGGQVLSDAVAGTAHLGANAQYNGSQWNRVQVGNPAWRLALDSAGDQFIIDRAAAGANPISWTNLFKVTSAGAVTFASAVTSTSATGGVGYATGAGGAVTQATNRTTGVTLNNVTGAITTNNTSLAALAAATFTVTNSTIAIADTIKVSIRSGATNVKTDVRVTAVAGGSFNLTVHNIDAATPETGAIIINFAVIKAVAA